MRISSLASHPDYSPFHIYARCRFNGTELKLVTFADEERGCIEQYVADGRGNLIPEGDGIKTCFRYGIVVLDFPTRPDLEAQLRKERKGK